MQYTTICAAIDDKLGGLYRGRVVTLKHVVTADRSSLLQLAFRPLFGAVTASEFAVTGMCRPHRQSLSPYASPVAQQNDPVESRSGIHPRNSVCYRGLRDQRVGNQR